MNTLSQTGDHDVHGTLEGFTGGRDNERGVINSGHQDIGIDLHRLIEEQEA